MPRSKMALVQHDEMPDVPIEAYELDAPLPEWDLEAPPAPVAQSLPEPDQTPGPEPATPPAAKAPILPDLDAVPRYRTTEEICDEFNSRRGPDLETTPDVRIDIASPHEIAVRVLLDLANWQTRPMDHGSLNTARERLQHALIVRTEGDVFRYDPNSGTWVPIPEDEIARAFVWYDGLPYGEASKGKRRTITLTEGLRESGLSAAYPSITRKKFFADVRPGFAFLDRFVAVPDEISQTNIFSHNPWHLARHAYPFNLPDITCGHPDPTADEWRKYCPTWHYMLTSCLPGMVEEIKLIQEFMAASRAGLAVNYQKGLLLLGDIKGANGKSTFLDAFKLIFPAGTVTHANPLTWTSDYHETSMVGSWLNILHETDPRKFAQAIDILKGLITGNEREARNLGGARFVYRPKAGQALAANELPPGGGKEAMLRRFEIIEFSQKFGKSGITSERLLAGIRREIPGIVLWMLNGLARLIRQGHLTRPASSERLRQIWEAGSSNALIFLARACRIDDTLSTPTMLLYRQYQGWCEANGVQLRNRLDNEAFKKALADAGHKSAVKGTPSTRCYLGIAPRPESEWE